MSEAPGVRVGKGCCGGCLRLIISRIHLALDRQHLKQSQTETSLLQLCGQHGHRQMGPQSRWCCCSVIKLCPTLCDPQGLQHARFPCPSLSPRVCSNSCPSSRWCHPAISSSVVPFSSCLQSFPASRSFPVSRLFPSGGQSIGVWKHQSFQ